jgi:hypothetical protein
MEYQTKLGSGGGIIDIKELRSTLSELYSEHGLFQVNETADSSEALQAIL